MKKTLLLYTAIFLAALATFSQTGSISNVQVQQRSDGSGLVDIYFNLSGPGNPYNVSLEASFNAGNTYIAVPVEFLDGDFIGISPGMNKHLIWDGLSSFPGMYSNQTKLKITATEGFAIGIPCPGLPTVVYQGQVYNTVQIGSHCWLKENMNVGTMIDGSQPPANNGVTEKYCYENLAANCDLYGALYSWDEMMQYSTTPGAKGICPEGWHVPTDNEWKIMEGTLDSQYPVGDPVWENTGWRGTDSGGKMKSEGVDLWLSPNTGATNESGLHAVPGGTCTGSGSYSGLQTFAYFWTSTQPVAQSGIYRRLDYNQTKVYRTTRLKAYRLSVRCLKDS